jgi:fibronectin type 3 domain-containing protein
MTAGKGIRIAAVALLAGLWLVACATYRPIQLAWEDQNPTKTVYRVERKEGPNGSYKPIAMLPPGSTGFTDPEAKEGVQYYYRIQAVTPDGQVLYSNEIPARSTSP